MKNAGALLMRFVYGALLTFDGLARMLTLCWWMPNTSSYFLEKCKQKQWFGIRKVEYSVKER